MKYLELVPGFYMDPQCRIYVNMAEFLAARGLPNVLEVRAIIWMEIGEIFADMDIIEMPSGRPYTGVHSKRESCTA